MQPSLFATVLSDVDRSLVEECDAELGAMQVGRRAALRLRMLVGDDPATVPRRVIAELLRLYELEIRNVREYALARARKLHQGMGRRPHSFAYNLVLLAALAECGSCDAAANTLGPPITAAAVRKARPRAEKLAKDILALVGAEGQDHAAFLDQRIIEMRQRLIARRDWLRSELRQRGSARAHPSARRFYATVNHDQQSELEPANAAARYRPQR